MSKHPVTTRGAGGVLRLAGQPDLPVSVLLRHDVADAALVRLVVILADDDSVELELDRAQLTAGVMNAGMTAAVTIGALTVLLGVADLVDFLLESYEG